MFLKSVIHQAIRLGILPAICLWPLLPLMAQPVYQAKDFANLGIREGLSENMVKSLVFDSLHYLWAMTRYGLNRYDGRKFDVYTTHSHPEIMPGNNGERINKLSDHHLAVIMREGFAVLDPMTLRSKFFDLPDTTVLRDFKKSAYALKWLQGEYLAVTTLTGFYVFNPLGKLYFEYTYYTPQDVGITRLTFGQEMFLINENELLIYVNGTSLYHYHFSKNKFQKIDPKNPGPWQAFIPRDEGYWSIKHQWSAHQFMLLNFKTGEFSWVDQVNRRTTITHLPQAVMSEFYWASYIYPLSPQSFAINCLNNGFYVFQLDTLSGTVKMNSTLQLPEYRCYSIIKDYAGNLWLGTNKGIIHEVKTVKTIHATPIRLPQDSNQNLFISDVLPIRDFILIATGNNKQAVIVLDKATRKIHKIISFSNEKLWFNEVSQMVQINEYETWCITLGGIVALDTRNWTFQVINEQLKVPANINAVTREVVNDRLIISSPFYPVLKEYNVRNKQIVDYQGKIIKARQEKFNVYQPDPIHVCFYGDGLVLWNKNENTFRQQFGQNNEVNGVSVKVYNVSGKGDPIWYFNTEQHGLLKYDANKNMFVDHTLESSNVYGQALYMSPIVDDQMWILHNNYLINHHLTSSAMRVFGPEDGMPEEAFEMNFIRYEPADKLFYLASFNHLLTFSALNYDTVTSIQNLPFIISEITLNDGSKIVHPPNPVKLKAYNNSFSVFLTNHDYYNDFDHYTYSIDGSSTFRSSNGLINIYALSPGEHTLTIKAHGNNYNGNDYNFYFIIEPLFYQTIWFYVGMGLFVLSAIFIYYFYRIKSIRKTAGINLSLAELEMKALHAQMNPHFLFNCLNAIKSLILQHEVLESSKYISRFSQLIRLNLDHSRRVYITLQEELDYLRGYIDMETLRFPDLKAVFELDSNIKYTELEIPAMILQPLVENAIWHGLQSIPGEKELIISVTQEQNTIKCKVEDNGKGLATNNPSTSDHTNMALKNIHKRLELLNQKYGQFYGLSIEDKGISHTGQGTLAVFSFQKS